jgi:hypothetical protein
MNRFKTLLIAAAVITGSSALASALPNDHDGRGFEDRDRYRYEDHDRGRHNGWGRRFDRDDHAYFVDRDDRRFRDRDDFRYNRDRDDRRFFVGERRWFNGYYWTWDGDRWCRSNNGVSIYLRF